MRNSEKRRNAPCGYQIPQPFRTERFCRQSARWVVEFTTPDDGTMRRRAIAIRCLTHSADRFLPKGASGITTLLLSDTYCDSCDGCGWVEGGATLQTTCADCKGTGRALGLSAVATPEPRAR